MTSGFTFAVACSVPEYVHSKPISTHSGWGEGGEKRREGRLMILSSQGMTSSKEIQIIHYRLFLAVAPSQLLQ